MTAAIERVGVVGCGLMGAGIAEVSARAGVNVIVREVDADALERGRARIEASIGRALHREKVSADEAERALARLRFTTDIGDLADRQLVVEAVTENENVKL